MRLRPSRIYSPGSLGPSILLAASLAACAGKPYIKAPDATLGQVVIYRNGVAYYERHAHVVNGTLTVTVPRDRVDDFMKSLTVVDRQSGQPVPVSFPRRDDGGDKWIAMTLQLPTAGPSDVTITYVTESPSWKPSYRVAVGDNNKVMLEGWAIVDNTSGEDWRGVRVGVGSSSALSFRYDLWSIRTVERQTLAARDQFAVAPPAAVSPLTAKTQAPQAKDLAAFDAAELDATGSVALAAAERAPRLADEADGEKEPEKLRKATPRRARLPNKRGASEGYVAGGISESGMAGNGNVYSPAADAAATAGRAARDQEARLNQMLAAAKGGQRIMISSSGNAVADGWQARASQRANTLRNQLIERGVAPGQIEIAVTAADHEAVSVRAQATLDNATAASLAPVGESHFESTSPMDVGRGTSVMVSMVKKETQGRTVYLYDADSERGNDHYAFLAVRLTNPTESTLEAGPVTVYGNKRFIGEGITEPIPPKATVLVPYALDRQVLVTKSTGQENQISRLLTVSRGIVSAAVQHVSRTSYKLTNRGTAPATVFVKHRVTEGWQLLGARGDIEKLGDAYLFEVTVPAGGTKDLDVSMATPMERTLDLGEEASLRQMKLYVDTPAATPQFREQMTALFATHKTIVDTGATIESVRQRLADYRERLSELQEQIVTLQLVKTGGELLSSLKSKMRDISDRVQKATLELVEAQEQLMLAKIRFADGLVELKLDDALAAGKVAAATK